MVKRKGTQEEKIALEAIEILKSNPDGIRYSELAAKIKEKYPDINLAALGHTVSHLDQIRPKEIYKPAWGLFQLIKFRDEEIKEETELEKPPGEKDFYQPFADWLVGELGECERATALGQNIFRDKWNTPDVIGIREPKRGAIVTFSTEVVSAEIKTDTTQLITAFGQACAYLLFSHNVYLVVPKTSKPGDIARLDSLCRILGIGLILFNNSNTEDPEFEIRVRSVKHDPDMFHLNEKMEILVNDKELKEKLF